MYHGAHYSPCKCRICALQDLLSCNPVHVPSRSKILVSYARSFGGLLLAGVNVLVTDLVIDYAVRECTYRAVQRWQRLCCLLCTVLVSAHRHVTVAVASSQLHCARLYMY